MKRQHAIIAALAASALLLSSCVYTPGVGYGTYTYSTNGYNSTVAWTSASYDADGFPIFGYSYGRPVYGYTEAGAAIFTVAALTALCFVPHWKPAPWYHGHWHYPARVHRCAAPPHCPPGHRPGLRPHGGMNAPIHRNPGSVMAHHKPAARPHASNRPGSHAAPRPGNIAHNRPAARPGNHAAARPGNIAHNKPFARPGNHASPRSHAATRPGNHASPRSHAATRPSNIGQHRPAARAHGARRVKS